MAAPSDALPRRVRVVEVGPRDGLQNELRVVPTDIKLEFVRTLVAAGLETIEVSSFVRADRIPQLSDASELFGRLEARAGIHLVALVPNLKGLDRALACGVRSIAVFTAASDTFNQRNINRSVADSLVDIRQLLERARAEALWTRGYVSTAFGCPYEGAVDSDRVAAVVGTLLELGCAEVSVGDTIGVATPADIERVLERLLREMPVERLALHLHDTRGTALANVLRALQLGVSCFDSSAGGIGGCPYAPGAAGNLATEDLIYLLDGLGIASGVDPDRLREASQLIESVLERKLPSRVLAAPPWPRPKAR